MSQLQTAVMGSDVIPELNVLVPGPSPNLMQLDLRGESDQVFNTAKCKKS